MARKIPHITALVMAAGAASRMGTVKQLLPWQGSTFLENALQQLKLSQISQTIVILGAHADAISNKIGNSGAVLVYNKDWKAGLGSSIGCGVRYVMGKKVETEALLIVLADQPLVDTFYINEMIAGFAQGKNKMIATNYGGRQGVPAIFHRDYFGELLQLHADHGARDLLEKYKGEAIGLDPGEKAMDVDTMAQYRTLLKQHKKGII
jgi:molybdenum cofactor cytidylyltransferase